jgi:hypothetical protein
MTPVSEIQATTGNFHQAGESHHAEKRSAREMDQIDGESDEDFEQMDVDENRVDDGSQIDQDTDQATNEDTDNEVHSSPQLPGMNPATDDELDSPAQATQPEAASEDRGAAPPRRELPFTRRDQPRAESREDAEETAGESDDDEL